MGESLLLVQKKTVTDQVLLAEMPMARLTPQMIMLIIIVAATKKMTTNWTAPLTPWGPLRRVAASTRRVETLSRLRTVDGGVQMRRVDWSVDGIESP